MEEDEEKDFAESLGISKADERRIKLSVEEAIVKTKTVADAILFLCGKNKMEIKPVFAGLCAGIATTTALIEMGKIPVIDPVAMPILMPIPAPVNIPKKTNIAA